jgi:hypothetical protein
MTRRTEGPGLGLYKPLLEKWMPKVQFRLEMKAGVRFDAELTWKTPVGRIRYLVEEKRQLRFQDVHVVADQLLRWLGQLGADHAQDRLLVLAPHVRREQAAVLEHAGIDYLDLVGNAHLQAPGLMVHVEGRQPPKAPAPAPGRPQKGWVKVVMAILVQPDLVTAPFRVVAEQAGAALGTVATCMTDLAARGLLHEGKQGRQLKDRDGLVALWVQGYADVLRPKLRERRFQMRAADKPELWARLKTVLGADAIPWALTGADAAERRTHFFHAAETEIYADVEAVHREIQKALVAQPAERGGNLVVIDPPGPLATLTRVEHGLPTAPDLLAYAELRYRETAQASEAADLLLPKVLQ